MSFGEGQKSTMGECDKPTAFSILDTFVGLGGNFIDTANGYQKEDSEIWLGEWMAARANRDQLVLATKFTTAWKAYQGDAIIQSNFGGNNAKSLRVSVDDSLRKLQTSYIDLLYVHWWDYTTPVPALMQSLNDLVTSGKVLYLGISDTPAWVVAKANEYARSHGMRPFSVYQGLWNAATRDLERDILPMCRDDGMAIAPWGPVGQGRFQTEAAFRERDAQNPGRTSKAVTPRDRAVSGVLEGVARDVGGGATLQGVAVAYVAQKAPYVFPIVGCRTLAHLTANVDALAVELSDAQMARIDGAYGFDFGFPHTFLVDAFGSPTEGAKGPEDVWLTALMGRFDWVDPSRAIRPVADLES